MCTCLEEQPPGEVPDADDAGEKQLGEEQPDGGAADAKSEGSAVEPAAADSLEDDVYMSWFRL